jgi:hypothetical protein
MLWTRWLTSWRTASWAVLILVCVLGFVATCLLGDVAIGLAATGRLRVPVLRIFRFTDVVLLLGYRVVSRYRDPQLLRVLGRVGRWLFVLARVLSAAAVLMVLPGRWSGAWVVVAVLVVAVVPFVAGYGAWVAGGRLSRATGRPARILGVPVSGRTLP